MRIFRCVFFNAHPRCAFWLLGIRLNPFFLQLNFEKTDLKYGFHMFHESLFTALISEQQIFFKRKYFFFISFISLCINVNLTYNFVMTNDFSQAQPQGGGARVGGHQLWNLIWAQSLNVTVCPRSSTTHFI